MSDVELEVQIVDEASKPADRISGKVAQLTGTFDKLRGKSVEVGIQASKMDRALGAVNFASHAFQAGYYGTRLYKAIGGIEGLSKAAKLTRGFVSKASTSIVTFGKSVLSAARPLTPFVIGGAGLLGLGKVGGIAISVLGSAALAIGAVAAAAVGGALALGGLAAWVSKTSSHFAILGQDLKLSLQTLAKYGASGDKLFSHAVGLARELGQDVGETTARYRDLLAAQFSPRLADSITRMGADLRVVGADTREVEGAIRAITQIKSAGKLMGDELMQLSEAKISVQLIREELGKLLGNGRQLSNLEVLDLQTAGKIDADTAIQGIFNAIKRKTGEKELGEAGKRWADSTIHGTLNRINTRAQVLGFALGERMAPSLARVSNKVLGHFERLLDSPAGSAFIDNLGDAFDKAGNIIVRVVDWLGSGAASNALDSLNRGLDKLVLALGWISRNEKTIGVLWDLGKALGYVLAAPFLVPGHLARIGWDLMVGLAGGITSAIPKVVEAVKSAATQTIESAKKVLGVHSPSTVFENIGYQLPVGQAKGIHAGEGLVTGAAASLALSAIRAGSGSGSWGPRVSSESPGMSDLMVSGPMFGGRGRRGAVSVHITQNITIEGGGDPNAIADASQEAARREIAAYFRQFEMET